MRFLTKKTAKQRRANRQRRSGNRFGDNADRGRRNAAPAAEEQFAAVVRLLDAGVDAYHGRDGDTVTDIAGTLAVVDASTPSSQPSFAAVAASRLLLGMLADHYESGWQPMDLLHVTRRSQKPAAVRLAVALLVYESMLSNAAARAPLEWVSQLDEVSDHDCGTAVLARGLPIVDPLQRRIDDEYSPFLTSWQVVADGTRHIGAVAWSSILSLIALWTTIPAWEPLGPLPSQWPQRRVDTTTGTRSRGHGHHPCDEPDDKVLTRIRGLLAKAEATDFPAEAETFTAKAQELMTRYAIDAALIAAATPGTKMTVVAKRIHVDNPYPTAKMQLLTEIARVNSVRAIWSEDWAIATVVGTPVDLEQTEMLYFSLLVQGTRAMARAGRNSHDRSTSFRRSFLYSYAVRIGQRLAEVEQETTVRATTDARSQGTDLVPILAARAEAVDDEFDRLFPRTKATKVTAYDTRGWHAGTEAANRAVLTAGGPRIEA